MKWFVCGMLLIIALLLAGCTAPESAAGPATTYPDLVGNWTGPMKGYLEGNGYKEYPAGLLTMVVREQNGRYFSGVMIEPVGNRTDIEGFSGVFHADGKTFVVVEYSGGYNDGTVLSADEIELIYMNDRKPAILFVDTFRRVP